MASSREVSDRLAQPAIPTQRHEHQAVAGLGLAAADPDTIPGPAPADLDDRLAPGSGDQGPGPVLPARRGGQIGAAALAALLPDPSAQGIAATMTHLVRSGTVPPAAQLPTVRALAAALHVGPSTVAEAWRLLALDGLVVSRGRRGTRVAPVAGQLDRRFSALHADGVPDLDLTMAIPDQRLLPDLPSALAQCRPLLGDLNRYDLDRMLPSLEELLRHRWPFPAEQVLSADGAHGLLYLILTTLFERGDKVAVENPTGFALLDVLEGLGLIPVPVACDDHGPDPTSVGDAAEQGVQALLFQPRMANPHGHTLTVERAQDLAAVLADWRGTIIEDDPAPELSHAPAVSLGSWLPHSTVLLRSWNKSHGPDLKMAAIGGPVAVVDLLHARQRVTSRGASRILQATLAHMLTDPTTQAQVARSRQVYSLRRERLTQALADRGLTATGREGLSVWVPVGDAETEKVARARLRARGIAVASSGPFVVEPTGIGALRIAVTTGHRRYEEIAFVIATS